MADQISNLSFAAIAVPVLTFITLVVDIPPFLWHIKHKNLAAVALVFWVVSCNFFDAINSLIWPTADISHWWHGFVLCDIEVKLVGAWEAGIPGALLCIMRNLSRVLDTENCVLIPTQAMRRKQLAFDFFFSIGIPIYMICIHYVVQPLRYYIYQIAGCVAAWDASWPSVVLMGMWPLLLSLGAMYYGVLVIIRMRKYQRDFVSILNSSNSNLTKSRFKRLFLMSMTLIAVVLPLQTYVFYSAMTTQWVAYDWDAIHGPEWWDVILIPTYGAVLYDRWIHIAIGFSLFFFFGLGKDALTMYRGWLLKLGLGAFFPNLGSLPTGQPSNTPTLGSFGSRARLFFAKKGSSNVSFNTRTNSVSTLTSCPPPKDTQKAILPISTIIEDESSTRPSHPQAFIHTNSIDDGEGTLPRGTQPNPLNRFFAIFRMSRSSSHRSTRRLTDGAV